MKSLATANENRKKANIMNERFGLEDARSFFITVASLSCLICLDLCLFVSDSSSQNVNFGIMLAKFLLAILIAGYRHDNNKNATAKKSHNATDETSP